MKSATYRDLAWDGLVSSVREAAEAAEMSHEIEAALVRFRVRFDAAVDAVPELAQALDRAPNAQVPAVRETNDQEADEPSIDPINRADEIAVQISETFKKR
jgi:hypothetical protein